MQDILYPYASTTPLASLLLDVGHDDYYGHSGTWPDVQDSLWLRLVTQQMRLSLTVAGKGSVESDVPGVDCAVLLRDGLGRRERGRRSSRSPPGVSDSCAGRGAARARDRAR